MSVEYWKADDEIVNMAQELVDEHHDALGDFDIVYLMRRPTAKVGGKAVWGSASKANAKQRAIADGDFKFVIELAADVWEDLDTAKKRALLDHELCHCTREEDDKGEIVYAMRSHDVEEFQEIVERHGRWTEGIQNFARQIELFGEPQLRAVASK